MRKDTINISLASLVSLVMWISRNVEYATGIRTCAFKSHLSPFSTYVPAEGT